MNRFVFDVDLQKVPLTNLIFCVTWAYYKVYNKIPSFEEVTSELKAITSPYLDCNVEGIDREYSLLKQDGNQLYSRVDNPTGKIPYYLTDEYFLKMLALHKDHISFINRLYVRELTNIMLIECEKCTVFEALEYKFSVKMDAYKVEITTPENGEEVFFDINNIDQKNWIKTIINGRKKESKWLGLG